MSVKTRYEKDKDKRTQYKVRYYFHENGKLRQSDTGWFFSEAEAKKEAERLKKEKEKADRNREIQRRDKQLLSAFADYIKDLKKESDKNESNTAKKLYQNANAIMKHHFPTKLQGTKASDITPSVFRSWMFNINKENLSGNYVRLCRGTLVKFNSWLANNGYYVDDGLEELIDVAIKKVQLKNKIEGNREEEGKRKILTVVDLNKIISVYYNAENGLGMFNNFYYYTFFVVLFFSGMRVEEIVGLQWKHVDFDNKRLLIRNAISKNENKGHALKRVEEEKDKLKNTISKRRIPIFDYYYELLIDYKESYSYRYNVKGKELEKGFVFPSIKNGNPYDYMKSKTALKELRRICEKVGVGRTDLQMFRHSCAMFLLLPPNDGMGYTEMQVKDFFGHADTEMLTSVYAKMSELQKSDRMDITFLKISTPNKNIQKTKEQEAKEHIIERMLGNNDREQNKARKLRIFNQIDCVIKGGGKTYYYREADKDIIKEYIDNHEDVSIDFAMEE